jgi:hypothetical protein
MWETYQKESQHLNERGISHEAFIGIDNSVMKLEAVDLYRTKDGKWLGQPNEKAGQKQVVACLSHYLMWKVMLHSPGDSFWGLEYDAEFPADWAAQYYQAIAVLPDDWDLVFLGSCCCKGKPTRHIGNNLYEVHYPLCGHAIMYRKKALPVLLDVHQKIWASLDIAMEYESLPKLRVYTILPRMVNQRATPLPP